MGVGCCEHDVLTNFFTDLPAIFFTEKQKIQCYHHNFVSAVIQIQRRAIQRVMYPDIRAGTMGISRHRDPRFGRNINQCYTCFQHQKIIPFPGVQPFCIILRFINALYGKILCERNDIRPFAPLQRACFTVNSK